MPMSADTAAAKDNMLGICHAIGTDFGFNPLFLRIPLAAGIIFSAQWTLIAYAAMGMAVLASRLLVRRPEERAMMPAVGESIRAERAPQPEEQLALAA
jgi:phage shock protein PspC (stress-responsive transcriptional regulator)